MKLDFKIQYEELNLAKLIDNEMAKKPKKVYMLIGTLKESGFDIIEESIIDTKAKITLFMGIDKKNTTKGLLENLLKYTKDIYVYNNNDLKEFSSNIYIFEYEKTATVYLSPANLSESGLVHDLSVFGYIKYNLDDEDDKKNYKDNVKMLMDLKKLDFIKLDKNLIQTLLDDKVIFSNKQYEHRVKSISEFLGKKETEKVDKTSEKEDKVSEDIYAADLNMPIIDLSKSDIDFDIPEVVDVIPDADEVNKSKHTNTKVKKNIDEVENEENLELDDEYNTDTEDDELFNGTIDLNNMLLTKSKVKLNTEVKEVREKETEETEKIISKKLDLNNISNYIFELPGKQQNGQDLDVIKIPNYIVKLIPNFFGFSENVKNEVINGSQYKVKGIKVEIVDAKTNSKTFDSNAKMMLKKGQTYMTIMSKNLENIEYEEKDISRIIKLSDEVYHIEIVSKDMQEYKIWSKIMNQKLKGAQRKYGIM